jgi:ATP-binding cassette, subfamily B, bacterial PglK
LEKYKKGFEISIKMVDLIKKLRFLLERKDKIFLFFLSILIVIAVILEIIGLAFIFPLLGILFDELGELVNSNSQILYFLSFFPEKLLSFNYIIGFYIFRFIYLIFVNYLKNDFSNNFSKKITEKLFKNYLFLPFETLISKNISTINKNLYAESYSINLFINSLLSLLIELTISITIIITLLIIDFNISFTVLLVVFFIGFMHSLLTKNYVLRLGKEMESVNSNLYKYLTETFNSIKDIIIYKYHNELIKNFSNKLNEKSRINTILSTFTQSTRYFLEFLTLMLIFFLVYLLLKNDYEIEKIISLISIFGMGIIRLIPSLNSILTATNNIKFSNHSVNLIFNELQLKKIKYSSSHKINFKKEIRISNLSYDYNGQKVFKNFNLVINKDDVIGIKGQSGSGKSTLLDIICGLKTPKIGNIQIDGENLNEDNFSNWIDQIAYVNQDAFILDKNIEQNIKFGRSSIKRENIEEYLKLFKLENSNKTLGEKGLNLSGGQKQRISLLRALLGDKQILLIDEPTSSQDISLRKIILDTIISFKTKKTIIIVSHIDDDLNFCDKIIEIG